MQLNNLSIDFASCIIKDMPSLKILEMNNMTNRNKDFDENELKSIYIYCKNINFMSLSNSPILDKNL